jgi:hypothetical protein
VTAAMPPAWADLIDGLTLLAKHQNNALSPLHCETATLAVMADPAAFTKDELFRLKGMGFHPCGDTFYSHRFGSA